MKKQTKLAIVSGALSGTILIGTPAMAFLGFIDSPLLKLADEYLFGGVAESVEDLIGLGEEAFSYVEEVLASNGTALLDYLVADTADYCSDSLAPREICNDISLDGGSVIDVMQANQGILGLPIPEDYQKESVALLLDSEKEPIWGYVSNPSSLAEVVKNAGDRGMATLHSNTVLSHEGQEAMKTRLETNDSIARTSLELSTKALKTKSNTKLLQMMAMMDAQQTILEQGQAAAAEMSRIDQQITNLNLSNISRTLDQEQTDKAVEQRVISDGLVRAVNGLRMY